MTGKSSNYDIRSQYSAKTSSSRNSSGNMNGTYLNFSMPPHSRNSTGPSTAMNGGSHQSPPYSSVGQIMNGHSTFHPLPPPPPPIPSSNNNHNMIDLSMNRSEGSAFEVYKKPEDGLRTTASSSFNFNGLPPPPPPPLPPPPLNLNESK